MKSLPLIFPLSALLVLLLAGPAVAEQSTKGKITFEDHVKPIFRQHCSACHHQGEKKGGLALDSYNAVVEGGSSGEIVFDDGDYDGSRLWQLMNHDDTPIMPPKKDKISADQLTVIQKMDRRRDPSKHRFKGES